MENENIEGKSLDDLLSNVCGLSAVGTDTQIRSIMNVIAKCTMIVSKDLNDTSEEIKEFNKSTTKLTKVIIALNVILAIATLVMAGATVLTLL